MKIHRNVEININEIDFYQEKMLYLNPSYNIIFYFHRKSIYISLYRNSSREGRRKVYRSYLLIYRIVIYVIYISDEGETCRLMCVLYRRHIPVIFFDTSLIDAITRERSGLMCSTSRISLSIFGADEMKVELMRLYLDRVSDNLYSFQCLSEIAFNAHFKFPDWHSGLARAFGPHCPCICTLRATLCTYVLDSRASLI